MSCLTTAHGIHVQRVSTLQLTGFIHDLADNAIKRAGFPPNRTPILSSGSDNDAPEKHSSLVGR